MKFDLNYACIDDIRYAVIIYMGRCTRIENRTSYILKLLLVIYYTATFGITMSVSV